MAPEQARARSVDKRADIWAFGCVLFESLTGRVAFSGEDVSDVLASVLKSEPNWDGLPPDLNPRLRNLLRRCLQKDPQKRYRDIGDVRMEIEELLADPSRLATRAADAPGRSSSKLPWVAAIVLAALSGVAVWYLKPQPATPPRQVFRFAREAPKNVGSNPQETLFAVSPSGDRFVYATNDGLYLYRLNEEEPRRISGTEGEQALDPFFKPDGQWIGYRSRGQLKKAGSKNGRTWSLLRRDQLTVAERLNTPERLWEPETTKLAERG